MDEEEEEPRIVSLSECLGYFDRVEQEMAETPALVPRPEGVAHFLATHCGPEVVAELGSRLVALGDSDPAWKTKAVVLFLGQADDPAAADALQRFAAATPREDYRELAGRSLLAINERRGGRPEV
jgi:hypothetical protein